MIYIIVFFLTAWMIHKGSATSKERKRIIWFAAAILIISIVAGMRDYSVGTDVRRYALSAFNGAKVNVNIFSYFKNYRELEPGYLLLAYMSARIFPTAHGFFFMFALINYSLILNVIKEYEREIKPWMAWLVYCFLFFGDSLNIMRQSMALAITLYGFRYIRTREKRKFILTVLVACTFHITAIMAFVMYFFYELMQKKVKWIHYVWIILVIFAVIAFYNPLLLLGIKLGLDPKFLRYLSDSSFHFIISSTVFRVIPLLIILVYWKKYSLCKEAHFFLLVLIVELLMYQMATISNTLYRLSAYASYYRIFAYSVLCKKGRLIKGDNAIVVPCIMVIYLFMIFFYEVIINNGNSILPYTSEVLHI